MTQALSTHTPARCTQIAISKHIYALRCESTASTSTDSDGDMTERFCPGSDQSEDGQDFSHCTDTADTTQAPSIHTQIASAKCNNYTLKHETSASASSIWW